MNGSRARTTVVFAGLDGSNPLAFLAALGTLRSLALAWREEEVRLGWRLESGAWRPTLHLERVKQPEEVVSALTEQLTSMSQNPAWSLGDDLTVSPARFHAFAGEAAAAASAADRGCVDFACALGCDIPAKVTSGEPTIQDTAFRTMSGAGHQHFLLSMRTIAAEVRGPHLAKALFEQWRYDDPSERRTMRWDPADDQRYALRWRDPSGDPRRKKAGAMLGANRLALEGLPLFPTAPVRGRLETTGFRSQRGGASFTWPIWLPAAGTDVVRSLVSLRELQAETPPRQSLQSRGIVEVFRCQRITVGKIRSFTPAESV